MLEDVSSQNDPPIGNELINTVGQGLGLVSLSLKFLRSEKHFKLKHNPNELHVFNLNNTVVFVEALEGDGWRIAIIQGNQLMVYNI